MSKGWKSSLIATLPTGVSPYCSWVRRPRRDSRDSNGDALLGSDGMSRWPRITAVTVAEYGISSCVDSMTIRPGSSAETLAWIRGRLADLSSR